MSPHPTLGPPAHSGSTRWTTLCGEDPGLVKRPWGAITICCQREPLGEQAPQWPQGLPPAGGDGMCGRGQGPELWSQASGEV